MKNVKDSLSNVVFFIDSFALTIIGIISAGYALFASPFAELHLSFDFLNFPVFIGEILLFICMLLFATKLYLLRPKFNKKHFLIMLYLCFVLYKAFYGYHLHGPFAFRHAALFYYQMFAIFGYYFYCLKFFKKYKIILFLAILSIFIIRSFVIYWVATFVIFCAVLIRFFENKKFKYLALVLLVIATPYKVFFNTSRMMMLANFVVGLYVTVSMVSIARLKKMHKLIFAACAIVAIIIMCALSSPVNTVKSVFRVDEVIKRFQDFEKEISEKEDQYVMENLGSVRIYNDSRKKSVEEETTEGALSTEKGAVEEGLSTGEDSVIPETRREATEDFFFRKKRNFYSASNNIIFRIFIWRDMIVEMMSEKPFFGFSFGKPLRSRSLEILDWARIVWARDGWVGAHNSFLHIIYRAGVVGVGMVALYFVILFRMIAKSIKSRSIIGILLCGIIINWFVAANFLLILELPYTAIPIWMIYGMTFAYVSRLKMPVER